MRSSAVVLAGLLLLSLAPAPARAATQVVHMRNLTFDPANVTIAPGDSVQWVNDDAVTHTATDDGGAWDTGDIAAGQSRTLTFPSGADFTYRCVYHAGLGMVGALHVAAPDQPPVVSIGSPAEGATVHGDATVNGTASDADGNVTRVDVRVDGGAWQAAQGTANWSFAWDTTQVDDGARLVEARAVDDRGTASLAAQRNVTVANPPGVAWGSPEEGATLRGNVTLNGTASDPGPHGNVSRVEVAVDGGAWQAEQGTANWSFAWATRGAANGTHTLHARSTDGGGLRSAVADRSFVVDNAPPTVGIASPAEGALVHDAVEVTGTAGEAGPDGRIERVEVAVDAGAWRNASGTANWTFAWDTREVADGAHTLRARSFDGRVFSDEASRGVQVKNHWADLALVALRADVDITSATLTATVANRGSADAGAFAVNFTYTAGGRTTAIGAARLDALPTGATRDVQVAWSTLLKVGNFTIRAEADVARVVPQLERGNDAKQGFACLPDLAGLTCLLPPIEVR